MMYSKACPICGDVVMDNDMDKLIERMKTHLAAHDDETADKKLANSVIPPAGDTLGDEKRMKTSTANTSAEPPTDAASQDGGKMKATAGAPIQVVQPEPITASVVAIPQPAPNIAAALCNMQKHNLCAITDSANPFFNSKYADLSSVWGVIRKPLTDSGLSIMQYPQQTEGEITVITRLCHISGEFFETRLTGKIVPDKNGKATIQALGSLITYLRRYSLSMLVGVAPKDDDDGNAAAGSAQQGRK